MNTHTPGPWKVTRYMDKVYVDHDHGLPEDYWTVAQTYGPQAEANADYIVHACNAHEELLTALKNAKELLRTAQQYFPKSIKNRDTFHLLNVLANSVEPAIAKAE